jgi:hypothetical protein
VIADYLEHDFKPEELLHFVELRELSQAWEELGLNDEGDLTALQLLIMMAPKKAPVVKGTGGMRKIRFSAPGSNVGKRGAMRICYAYFEEYHLVLLMLAYSKNESDDLSEKGKAAIRE